MFIMRRFTTPDNNDQTPSRKELGKPLDIVIKPENFTASITELVLQNMRKEVTQDQELPDYKIDYITAVTRAYENSPEVLLNFDIFVPTANLRQPARCWGNVYSHEVHDLELEGEAYTVPDTLDRLIQNIARSANRK